MKFGQFLWQPTPNMGYSHAQRLRETIEMSKLAEELGFDSVVYAENHFSNYGLTPNPLMLASSIGQHTDRIRMATGVAVLPFWHPVRLAEDIAVADQLLGGRLDVYVGRGYQQVEFAGLGIPYDERQERYEEALEILVAAWTTDDLQYSGQHYQVGRPVNVLPKPLQKPHPPIIVSAVSEDSVRTAARTDFKVFGSSLPSADGAKTHHELYLEERQRVGRTGDHWVYGMNRQVYVTEATGAAYEAERETTLLRSRELARLGEGLRRDVVGYDRGRVISTPIDGERELEEYASSVVFGNPDEVVAQIRSLRDDLGVAEMNVMTEFGGLDHAAAKRSVELLGKEVLPLLREDEA